MNNFLSTPGRVLVVGGLAAGALAGTLALDGCGSSAPASSAGQASVRPAALTAAAGSTRITVTGTGTVNGTPNQLTLDMGVQVNAGSVGSALSSANDAIGRVTTALNASGVASSDIQTSGLSISPNYPSGSQVPSGYSAGESLTATLTNLSNAGTQIDAAVHAGGNATTISGISLNLTDDSSLLAAARAQAVADAQAKATQYAKALGEPLGPVVSITDQSTTQPVTAYPMSSAAASRGVQISPGSQQLSVSITAVFSA